MSWYDEDNDEYVSDGPSWIDRKVKSGKPDYTKHYPNRNESKVLRKLMSQTGLTEKEIREHKKYRVELSKAQTAKGDKSELQRLGLRILKNVLRELKLPKEHPKVLERLKIEIERSQGYYGWRGYMLRLINPKNIIAWSKK